MQWPIPTFPHSAAALPHSAPVTAAPSPFFSLLLLSFLYENEMGHSAVVAFQHCPHADIPLHNQCLDAISVQAVASECAGTCLHLRFTIVVFVMYLSYQQDASRHLQKCSCCFSFLLGSTSSHGHLKRNKNNHKFFSSTFRTIQNKGINVIQNQWNACSPQGPSL